MKYQVSSEGWDWAKEAALTTVHKTSIEGKEITGRWKEQMIQAEHSPIREVKVHIKLDGIPRWIADQLVRSKDESFMGTMRPDRGNKPREKQLMTDETVLLKSSNAQHIIDTARKRLCVGKVSPETYKTYETIVGCLAKTEPELAFHCVPNCVYRAGCPEMKTCGLYQKFYDSLSREDKDAIATNIGRRYRLFGLWSKEAGNSTEDSEEPIE